MDWAEKISRDGLVGAPKKREREIFAEKRNFVIILKNRQSFAYQPSQHNKINQ